ncbi:STAS domain-containing protein [Planosporangium sp. 12N6]|uniref:STAS domain-containing protein n=1 Tax=Planosporangium spinosum TaxID=3402278 RepID=UPI003CF784AD
MTHTVTPTGEIDLLVAGPLRAAIQHALDSPYVGGVVVDLHRVTFLDCAGVGALVAGHNTATQRRTPFRVINPQRQVRRVLDVTGVLAVLTHDSDPAPLSGRHVLLPGRRSCEQRLRRVRAFE